MRYGSLGLCCRQGTSIAISIDNFTPAAWCSGSIAGRRRTIPRYRVAPHDSEGPYSEKGQGEGPELQSIDTTFCDSGSEIFFCSGYSAREVAQLHQKDTGETIYVNSVSRKIVRRDFKLATNAPVYYAVADSPVYTLISKDGKVVRAYWPTYDE